jgi:Protein of unknown function (DUF2478)
VSFDAQCDVAAIVYGADDDPDRVIAGFAADLRRSGCHPVGVVQRGRSCRSDDPRLGVTLLPDGEVVGLALADEPSTGGCRLDPDRLAGLSMRLAAAIDDGADLVIINRFGRSEAEGKGLIDLIRLALDIPVLIAVPEQRFADWIRFSEGMNVRLACKRDALDQCGAPSPARRGRVRLPARSARLRNEAPVDARESLVVAVDASVTTPPFVLDVLGEIALNGEAVGLRIQRSAQGLVDLCLRIDDVQHLIGILLALSCEAKRRQPPMEIDAPPPAAIPLPVSAINVGQTDDGQTFLMLEVGTTSLMFAVPQSTLAEVGQTLLALSARTTAQPS